MHRADYNSYHLNLPPLSSGYREHYGKLHGKRNKGGYGAGFF